MQNISNRALLIGYIQAFVAVFIFYGFNNLAGRYVSFILDANPIIYSCTAFASCALVLLAYAGHGPLARETMRSFDTWNYGFILMLSYITGMLLFGYVSATEGTMLQKVSVLFGLLASWFFLARRPDIFQIIGTIAITIGVAVVINDINSPNKGIILLLAFLYGALQIIRVFVAELHRPHLKAAQQTNDPKAKARVIAFVMFVISLLFLSGSFIVALAQSIQEVPLKGLPTFADFFHGPTIFAGLIAGILIVAPLRILEFSSTYIIKAENFTAITALSFVATLFWEWATAPITGLSLKELSQIDILAGFLITAGGLFIALTRAYAKKHKKYIYTDYIYKETQELNIIEDTRDTLSSALEYLNADVKKVSNALELPIEVIEKIFNDKDKVYAFNKNTFDNVMRNYRKNISSRDALTGLLNRAGFIAEIKKAIKNEQEFCIFYLDLNKFKPINDTYGHEAGDFVLQEIAKRFKNEFTESSKVARLGGDEFCILLKIERKNAEDKIEFIQNIVSDKINYKDEILEVGTSVGVSSYPQDSDDVQDLIKLADKQMYTTKIER